MSEMKKHGQDPGLVLDFCVELGRRMVVSGSNLERVQLAIERVCHAYRLRDVSLYLMNGFISLGARDAEGCYASRQVSIPAAGIHLQRLKQLNRLSYSIASATPPAAGLTTMLDKASETVEYKDWMIVLAQMVAMSCLCRIFGGGIREILAVDLLTVALYGIMRFVARPVLGVMVTNGITMFLAGVAAILIMKAGVSQDAPVILITIAMLVIPGIPLVNAVRNLLSGNELNGLLQIFKATIETMALGVGLYLALASFGMRSGMAEAVVTPLAEPVQLVILSFLASCGFAAVFRVAPHDIWRAGLGGALTRVVLLILPQFVPNRMLCCMLAALAASLYAEAWATVRKDPSTYFVYPAIIPLIPGDLFYYALVGLYMKDYVMFRTNGIRCLTTLLAMCVGFVISSIIAHYVRKVRHLRFLADLTGKS